MKTENQEETINLPKYAEAKISNIVITGKFPFRRFLDYEEINQLIEKSHFGWGIINQDTTPQLCTYIVRENSSKTYIGLWHTGSFIMSGLKCEREAEIYYKEVLKELRNLVPGIFKNNQKGGKINGR